MASSTVNAAHADGQNQQFSQLGVIGTLGTADTQGTALTLPIGVNPSTGAMYVQDLSGISGTTNVQGSVQVTGGSIVVTAGTLGTISNVGKVHDAGTIAGGTLGVVSSLTAGSIAVTAGSFVGTVAVNTPGTITSGTVSVNTPGTITSGSIAVIAGTIGDATVKIGTINSGTINAGTINVGTIGGKAASGAASVANPVQIAGTDGGGTVYSPFVTTGGILKVVDTAGTITSGSIAVTAGTIGDATVKIGTINAGTINAGTIGGKAASGAAAVANPVQIAGTDAGGTIYSPLVTTAGIMKIVDTAGTISAGTINAGTMNSGTLNAGTINTGTFRNDGRPARNILSFATTIAFAGSAFATLVGSSVVGVGTSIWVNDVSIVNNGGTQKYGLVFGSAINGSAVLAKGQFGPQGGVQKAFPMPVNAGMTNFDLNAWAEGAGTADFTVSYFISA